MRCWKPGSRLDGVGFSGDGFLAMPSDHIRGVERDEPKAQALAGSGCRGMLRDAITMTPACMGRSGIHFTREHVRSKKALRSSGLRVSWQARGATFPSSQKVDAPSAPRAAASGEKKFDWSETVARFSDILNREGRSSCPGPARSLSIRRSVDGSSQRGEALRHACAPRGGGGGRGGGEGGGGGGGGAGEQRHEKSSQWPVNAM